MRMIVRFLLFGGVALSFVILSSGFAPIASDPAIFWNNQRKLTWNDFQARQKPTGRVLTAAVSTCGFGFEAKEENHQLVSVAVSVKFYPEKSWKNPAHQTENVLAHEQIHFDITELMGRKLHKEILQLKAKGKINQRVLKKLYDRISKEHGELQDLYDKQTDHSLNVRLQAWWAQSIESQLVNTSGFSNYQLINLL